jgi:hemoglobin-like flavoprotein
MMGLNVDLIRESFEKAKPIAGKVADKFYEILWEDFPASQALFEDVDMKAQKKSLMAGLTMVVDNVDNTDKLVPYLKDMGKRHLKYGAVEEHYDWVGQSLIKTFSFFFGDDWTEELEGEWVTAYGVVSSLMLEGAAEFVPDINEIRKKAKGICNNLMKEVLEEGIDEQFEAYARAKVRKVLFKILEEESEDLFNRAA